MLFAYTARRCHRGPPVVAIRGPWHVSSRHGRSGGRKGARVPL